MGLFPNEEKYFRGFVKTMLTFAFCKKRIQTFKQRIFGAENGEVVAFGPTEKQMPVVLAYSFDQG